MLVRAIFFSLFLSISLFAQEKPVVVLELFTSQGCSSCPPADDILEEIKNNSDDKSVIPLSYHVDYWDYIGWKDPYASKDYTTRQKFYGRKFRSSSIYTPQLVINGDEHLVGSNRVSILSKIKKQLSKTSNNSIAISNAKREKNSVTFSYNVEGDINEKNIHYILVLDEKTTSVNRGENRNRTLTNSNIVVNEKIEGLKTKSGNYELKIPEIVAKNDALKVVVLISDQKLSMQTGAQLSL